jgi:hypothetical protein
MSKYLLILTLPILAVLGSCGDPCADIICGTNQSCVNGQCYCADGYEGPDCTDFAADKYIGSWQVVAGCQQGFIPTHNSQITYDPQGRVDRIVITNFMNRGLSATVGIFTNRNNKGNLIQFQGVQVGSLTADGQGYFDEVNNRIVIDVQYFDFQTSGFCTLTYY